jgi:hypothetical protein
MIERADVDCLVRNVTALLSSGMDLTDQERRTELMHHVGGVANGDII